MFCLSRNVFHNEETLSLEVSGAELNVCKLPSDRRQQLNISCNFDAKEGCTTLYTSPRDNYWKYQTQPVGTEEDGGIAIDHQTGAQPIAFESHTTTDIYSNVGVDDVVIEIERSSSTSTLSASTIPTTLKSSLITSSAVIDSNSTETPTTTASLSATSFTLSTTSSTATSKLNTTDNTQINPQTSKITMTALKTTSTSNATYTTISTPKLTATPTKTNTTSTSVAATSSGTAETPTETPTIRANISQSWIKSIAPTTTISTTLTINRKTIEMSTTFQATHRSILLLPTTNYIPKVTSKTSPRISIIATTTPTTILPSTTQLTQATTTRDTTSLTTIKSTSPRSTISFAMSSKTTITPFTNSTQTTSPTFIKPSTTSTTAINTATRSSGIQMATLTTTRNTEINTPMTANTPTVISTTIVSPITTPVSRKTLTPTSNPMSKQTYNTRLSFASTALTIPKTVTTPTTMFSKTITQDNIIVKTISDVLSTPQITSNHITIPTKSTAQASTRKITRSSLSTNTANEISKHSIYSLLITTPSASINISSITTPNTSMNTPSITTQKTPASTDLLSFTALTDNYTLSSTKYSSRDSATQRTVFMTSSPFTTMNTAVKLTRKTTNEISRKETTSAEEKRVNVSDIAITISYEKISTDPTKIADFSPSGSYEKLTVNTTNPALFQSDGNIAHPNSEEGSDKHKGITGSSISNEKLIIIVLSALAGAVVLMVLLFVVHKLKHKYNSNEFITDHVDIDKMNMGCEPTFYKTRIHIES
ncbi:hypothetical protein CHS0354_037932 [Potamilus streckersoni]|uniref:Uncharacterized protein n=1 Tax=Potamilus streckersoni TaxID=2493646 RepID=A0AAE0WAH5_9BIVA|nr:hypothetical protein CHS0354_037932 [Potamilus streckersoni]